MSAIQIEKPKILIVEGRDDELFFSSLLNSTSVGDVQVMPIGGKTQLTKNLKALQNAPNFDRIESMGIIRDGDSDPQGAFQSVCNSLTTVNLHAPSTLGVSQGSNPRTAVFVLPDGATPGMLEDLCIESISSTPIMECIDKYFDCIEKMGLPFPSNMSKAKAHTFLAAQQQTGKRLGEAAAAGYWPFHHPAYNPIKEFFQIL